VTKSESRGKVHGGFRLNAKNLMMLGASSLLIVEPEERKLAKTGHLIFLQVSMR